MRVCKMVVAMGMAGICTVMGGIFGIGMGFLFYNAQEKGWLGGYLMAGGLMFGGGTFLVATFAAATFPFKDPWEMVTLWDSGTDRKPKPEGEV